MLSRFRCPHPSDSAPVLLPTKAITAPRETTEVQPFIVLCPADIVTLYQALYPHGSSAMVEGRDIRGPMSSRSSSRQIFGRSPGTGFEIGSGSVFSGSGSSVTSESASMTSPLLERSSVPDDRRSFMSIPPSSPSSFHFGTHQTYHGSNGSDPNSLEKFGLEVRSAVEAMMGRLGADVTSGRCHPCAEKWAVVFVSPDGKELSLKMRKDWDEEDDDDDEDGNNSDSEDEAPPVEVTGLDRIYNQLKESVVKLVAEYEIPEEPVLDKPKFSNRPSAAKANSAPSAPTVEPETTLDPTNPFHPQSNLTAMINASQSKAPAPDRSRGAASRDGGDRSRQSQQPPSLLFTMLQAASSQCLARGDYVSAQQYHRAVLQARKLPASLQRDEYAPLLHIFSRDPRDSIERSAAGIEECEAWFVWLTLAQERHEIAVENMMRKVKDLRDKMWYVTDVRNSAAYDEARNVTLALKKMGMPQQSKPAPARGASRNLSHRMSTSSFSLLRSDTFIDILAASPEHGGLNKLSDEQASMTFEYLSRYSVENFCKGEERIHRFCLEIDKCVTKLVGEGILAGPVLWSSELFARDDREMAINRQKGELYLAGVGTLSVAGDDDDDVEEGGRSSKRSLDMLRRPNTRNRSTSMISSIHDMPSSRGKTGTKSNAGLMDSIDRQDLFGMPSPALPPEPQNTYWSPFSSQSSAGTSSGRPKTAHSPTSLSKSIETVNHQKRKFLGELKQSLTGLLLSDLGLEVFGQGSETDGWFSGGLGDECIQRKEEQEEAKRKAAAEKASKLANSRGIKGILTKKKSSKNVRKAANSVTFEALGKEKKGELAAPVATLENVGREPNSGEENSSSSDVAARSSGFSAAKKGGLMAFPYSHAFRRLLLKFSTHPNPFQKLQAIYELELLIVASLSSRSPGSMRQPAALPFIPSEPFSDAMGEASSRICSLQLSQPSNIEEAMANLEERRSNLMNSGATTPPLGTQSGARSPTRTSAPSADMIVDVLQHLFRQADVRPKTLFRDLQFVAAFVPASILDRTAIGKAFWDTGLAALGLKQDICRTMAEIADEIVAKDTTQRESESGRDRGANNGGDGAPTEYSRYTMQDAATMWNIAAKEGDPAAQRELAIFYLTNPTLLPRSTKPLSKPKDTFRQEMMVAKGEDPEKRDPATMCVAYHWMELSAQGGDELARKYLDSQREEW